MKTIATYKEIQDLIHPDLCWFIVYESILQATEMLEMEIEDAQKSSFSQQIFEYTQRMNICRILRDHVFHEEVLLSDQAYQQAMECFALTVPHVPTFALTEYLNFLEEWAKGTPNWLAAQVPSFSSIEVSPSC